MHLTRGYHALAFDFSLAVEDDELARYLEWLLDGLPEPGTRPEPHVLRPIDDGEPALQLTWRDEAVLNAADPAAFTNSLVQWLNRGATDPEYAVMSHAGGVALDGVACVLPADPESGKTTLTAGLVRAGYAYLTDEAVAFDWETGEIEPFPKPLSIDPGSQHLFPELVPPTPPTADPGAERQWQVPPSMFRPDAVGGRCRARYVVFPRYERDGPTRLEAVGRAEGLVTLARNTFRFRDQSRRALDALSGVIRTVDCYRLTVGNLDDACEAIDQLMSESRDG